MEEIRLHLMVLEGLIKQKKSLDLEVEEYKGLVMGLMLEKNVDEAVSITGGRVKYIKEGTTSTFNKDMMVEGLASNGVAVDVIGRCVEDATVKNTRKAYIQYTLPKQKKVKKGE